METVYIIDDSKPVVFVYDGEIRETLASQVINVQVRNPPANVIEYNTILSIYKENVYSYTVIFKKYIKYLD